MALPELLQDLAVIALVAAATMAAMRGLRQPAVLGYILAGIIIGPFTPPFSYVRQTETIQALGQVGLVFLLFAVGLEFRISRFATSGLRTVAMVAIEAGAMLWIGFEIGRVFGMGALESIFLGAILSVSSTAIIVRIMEEQNVLRSPWGQLALGVTLLEDIVAILLVGYLAAPGTSPAAALGSLALFLAATVVIGSLAVPRLVGWAAKTPGEALTITGVALALGGAILAGGLGFSVGLGAFLAGALAAESPAVSLLQARFRPLRDLFAAIFFVTVGMLLDPASLIEHAALAAACAAAVLIAKPLAVGAAGFLTGNPAGDSLRAGMAVVPVGEFSFVIAGLAATAGAASGALYAVAVGVSVASTLAAPYYLRRSEAVVTTLGRKTPRTLRLYISSYGEWWQRARASSQDEPAGWLARAALFYAAALGILVLGSVAIEAGQERVGPFSFGLTGALWAVVGLIALPFVVAGTRAFMQHTKKVLARLEHARTAQPLVMATLSLLAAAVAAALALAVLGAVLPDLSVLLLALALVGGGAGVLYRHIVRFKDHAEETVGRLLSPTEAADPEVVAAVSERYPFGISRKSFRVPAKADSIGHTIEQLAVRERTGATVVSIRRGRQTIVNPTPDTQIEEGDRVVMVGQAENLAQARRLLQAAEEPGSKTSAMRVEAGSPLVGVSLAAADIRRRTGATVLAVKRQNSQPVAPGPAFVFEAHDFLEVVGDASALEATRSLCKAAAAAGPQATSA